MDDTFKSIKFLEQKVIDLLHVYKLCRTLEERREIQQRILVCELELDRLREKSDKTKWIYHF